jgi:hypothetical protein
VTESNTREHHLKTVREAGLCLAQTVVSRGRKSDREDSANRVDYVRK